MAEKKCCRQQCKGSTVCNFVILPFEDHLLQLCEENWDKLQYPFTRRQETDMQHDLQDGSKYRALMQPGEFLSVPEHIGLILCSDGIPVFKSSGLQLWPIELCIANLPPEIRYNVQYHLVGGLWLGSVKPDMNKILKPILTRIKKLEDSEKIIRTKVVAKWNTIGSLLQSGQVHVEAQPSRNKTLYLLSFLNYPDSATNSSNDQGIRYAIDLINSESIVPGYKLDLIEASDDCDISWNGVANLVRNLFYSDKQVIAIVGPECSSVAQVVALADTPKFLSVAAFAALIDCNRWSRIGILYDPSVLEYVDSYRTFLNATKDYTVEFAFTSYVSLTYFPLAELKATYVRVIVSFLGRELQEKVLCQAYHMNMTYPRYQWILVDPTTAANPLGNVSIVYTNTEYTCDQDQMASALNRSVFAVIDKLPPLDTIEPVPGISDYEPFENCSDVTTIVECILTFDATLAPALALNRSIRPLMERGLSLSNYTSGEHSIASIIQQEIMNLSFAGMAGTIVQFDLNTGYPSAVITSLLQYSEEFGNSSTFAIMLNGTLHFKDVAVAFVSTDFDRIHRTTPIHLATVVVAIGVVVPLVVLVGIHVLNTMYLNVPSIKASSSNLNHFAYVGCYFILFTEVVYTSGELASFNIQAKTVLCNVFPWCLILGLTLVLSTVCVKTCRLYCIFTASGKGDNRRPVVKLKDNLLASIIVGLVLASAVLLTAWTWSHPLFRHTTNHTISSGETFVILLEDYCDTEDQAYWFAAAIIFETTLLASCVILAFPYISSRQVSEL
eukprot:Em0022g995a